MIISVNYGGVGDINPIVHGARVQSTSFNAEVIAAPEAGALFLFGSGLIGLVVYRRFFRIQ